MIGFEWLAGLLAAALSALGLGGGSLLLIWLTLVAGVDPATAKGVNLLFFLACAAASVLVYAKKKQIDYKIALWAILPGLPGALIGFWFSGLLPAKTASRLLAVILLLVGGRELFAGLPKAIRKILQKKHLEQ